MVEDLKVAVLSPLDMMWGKVAGFIPMLISVIVILVVGWIVATAVQKLVIRFLKLARLDTVSEKAGIANILIKGDISLTLSEIIGSLIYWLLILVVILAAVNALNLTEAADLLNVVILYIPKVIAAILILVLGIFLASLMAQTVRTAAANSGVAQAKGLGRLTQVLIIVFVAVQALQQLQIDTTLINLLIQAVIGSVALGVAIAIGLGCQGIVGKYAQSLIDSFKSAKR